MINTLPKIDKLFIIESDQDTILSRLQNRGHKRMDLNDKDSSNIFVNKSFEIIDTIKEIYSDDKLVTINNDNNLSDSKEAKNLQEILANK